MALCALLQGPLLAEERKSPTLEKIRNYKAIYVGHREASVPFSYIDNAGKAVGYSMDLCDHIVEAVKVRLNLPDLEVVPVPTTSGSRQMMLESGITDLQCGSVTNTLQRQRYVAFSVTTFAAGVKALVKKESGIRSIKDMRGKVIVTTSGTTSDTHVKAAALRQGMFLNYRNDPEFKKLIDETLIGLMNTGEFARIYDKWFMSPIPPKGKSLNLPMSNLLKQLTVTPSDKGI
ncbi:MAG: transporter substrate-binding domain-containing protein [Deltaproteobacteria bacterium]|nr:transporter substrate-binding domain-containing protein [Deltaproteobacteria bacterium]